MLQTDAQNIASKLGAMTDEQLNIVYQQTRNSWRMKKEGEICEIQRMACIKLEGEIDKEISKRANALISDMLTTKLGFGA